ncbi:Mpo1-like protein [Solilutibacter silvestris]|uniref:Mpo1-like protein n=1 Tax=Solilutibacter silvestris TaxID=1645665 RepID=UPI003D33D710
MSTRRYRTLQEFYPFYLSQHQNHTCRRLHFFGTSIAIALILYALASGRYGFLLLALVQGYAWAWVGHFFFEHNRPATFTYPLLSFMGDWKLWLDMLTGRVRW